MKKTIILTTLCFIASCLTAQESKLSDISATQDLSETVCLHFLNGEINEMIESIRPYWPIPSEEVDGFKEKTSSYSTIIQDRYGSPIDYMKINHETIGTIAIQETYLLRYKSSALRLIFTYYKNNEGWIVNSFKWDENFAEEFR